MREVLAARSGRDFTSVGAPRQHRRSRARPSIAALALGFAMRRPGRVLGALVFLGTAAVVSFNALTQSAPHPAPLFGASQRDGAPVNRAQGPRQSEPALRPTPPAVPQNAAAPQNIGDLLAPLPPARPVEETASISDPRNSDPRVSDPLGDLIRYTTGAGGGPATAAVDPDPRLMAAQRALTKLGFGPLTEDGLFGPMTRSAIERFEREQGLAVTGQLVPQTARALSVRSGVAID